MAAIVNRPRSKQPRTFGSAARTIGAAGERPLRENFVAHSRHDSAREPPRRVTEFAREQSMKRRKLALHFGGVGPLWGRICVHHTKVVLAFVGCTWRPLIAT